MTDSEELGLPVRWSVVGAVVAVLVVLLVAAGFFDRRRRAGQLEAVREIDCAAVFSSEVLKQLETLRSKKRVTGEYARSVAKEVQTIYPRGRRVEVLYEREGEVWAVSPWHGPRPGGERELPAEWGEWSSFLNEESCRARSEERSFVVGRRVELGGRQRAVVITRQPMSD